MAEQPSGTIDKFLCAGPIYGFVGSNGPALK